MDGVIRVFISWSKPRSRAVAAALHRFIDGCINAARPWVSDETPKGAAWAETIMNKLDEAVAGIVCLTRENQREPWLLFEGGALAKQKVLHVFSIDVPTAEIAPPFGMYQVTMATKDDVLKLLHTINGRLKPDDRRTDQQLNASFEMFWPALEAVLKDAGQSNVAEPAPRTDREMLEEIVANTREIAAAVVRPNQLGLDNNLAGFGAAAFGSSPYGSGSLGVLLQNKDLRELAERAEFARQMTEARRKTERNEGSE